MIGFEELPGRPDIVSVHARATPGNRHLVGAAEFARMRRGSFFINTARESLAAHKEAAS
jgi:D-3-phosphoglycerate dehydrogenase / 2-oxoglutarate reductase